MGAVEPNARPSNEFKFVIVEFQKITIEARKADLKKALDSIDAEIMADAGIEVVPGGRVVTYK